MGSEEKTKMSSAIMKVKFVGWRNPPKNWGSWVLKMCSLHQSTWKKAGIYEAIMSSTYPIKRHDDLIFELASRWCSQTNTLVFPWGEATLTLEDMLVLGGFSASGVSALSCVENDAELLGIKDRLELERKELVRSKSRKALPGKWMEIFTDCGNDLEHAAFLSLWLSRFVFTADSTSKSIINKQVFPVAAQLSKGIKIALGPVVLAMLYRDLTALTKRLRFTQLVAQSRDNTGPLDLRALFHLVQIWAWERFPMLKPVPNCMYTGEKFPRLARWSNVKIPKDKVLTSAIDSADKAFLWCPYGAFPKRTGRDLESLELLGFDSCIEKYQPQRVARQFRLDQGIPSEKVCTTLASSQVKVESAVDCGPPGFSHRIEVINVVDSDSDDDDDCGVTMTELSKLPAAEAGSRRPFPSSVASKSLDVAIEDACFVDKTEEDCQSTPIASAPTKKDDYKDCVNPHGVSSEAKLVIIDDSDEDNDKNNDSLSVSLQHSNMASAPSDNEANETMDILNGSVHETKEDEEEEVAYTNHDEIEGVEGRNTSVLGADSPYLDDSDEDNDENNESRSVSLQHSNLLSAPSDNEANEAMDILNGSVHETEEDEEEEASYAHHDEIEGVEGRNTGLLGDCDAESYTKERSNGSDLDLEARISRLEDIVYPRIKALKAAR